MRLLLLLLFLSVASVNATTRNCNGSLSDCQAKVNASSNGDTVTIATGTFTWASTLTVSKAVTLKAALYATTPTTIIKDNVQTQSQLIYWDLRGVSNGAARITGIAFQDGGRHDVANGPAGVVHIDAYNNNGTTFRFDHNTWTNLNGFLCFDSVVGVVDHNTFTVSKANGALDIYGDYWNGDTAGFGDKSWTAPTNFGSGQFLFIEDNSFSNSPNTSLGGVTDAVGGARFVVRYNNIYNMSIYNHGTDSTGRTRSCRAIEGYNNTFTGSGLNKFVSGTRGGLCLFHDNSISGYWDGLTVFDVENFRTFASFPVFGGADGTNPWDVNSGPYFNGSAASDSSNLTVTVSGNPNWSQNLWLGYVLRRTSDVCSSGTLNFGEILGNGSNTITYTGNGGYGPPVPPSMAFCTGDALEIRRVQEVMDGTGRAGGSLVTGGAPTPPPGWNNQVSEGDYSWNNHSETHNVNFSTGTATIKVGEHIFNDTALMGYTPYCYPHPLVSGSPCP